MCLGPLIVFPSPAMDLAKIIGLRPLILSVAATAITSRKVTMAFADPQSITVNAVPISLPRTETDKLKALYASTDGNTKLTISHQPSGTRTRRLIRVDSRKVAADPLTAVNTYQTLGIYLVVDQPTFGFSSDDVKYLANALKSWLTDANIVKIFGQES